MAKLSIEAAVVTSSCGDMAKLFPFLAGWSRSMFSFLPSGTQGGSFGDTIVLLVSLGSSYPEGFDERGPVPSTVSIFTSAGICKAVDDGSAAFKSAL
jgi:hypothetical protein